MFFSCNLPFEDCIPKIGIKSETTIRTSGNRERTDLLDSGKMANLHRSLNSSAHETFYFPLDSYADGVRGRIVQKGESE